MCSRFPTPMCTTAHKNAMKAIGSPYAIRLSVLVDHVACLFVSVRHVKPYIYPIWGEKVACAAVSRHLCVLQHKKCSGGIGSPDVIWLSLLIDHAVCLFVSVPRLKP